MLKTLRKVFLRSSFFCLALLAACATGKLDLTGKNDENTASSALEKGFRITPDSIQTSVYWYWLSDNVSKEGVIEDLKAMKRVGINRAFIGNIWQSATPSGKVKLFSDEWWDVLHTALKTAGELNIEIGIFNSPGWSQSGGPWIKPERSMRYLASTETIITGGRHVDTLLKKPDPQFQDVRVIAFKAPKGYGKTLADLYPVITSVPKLSHLQYLIDRDTSTQINITDTGEVTIDIKTDKELTARSLTIYPAHYPMTASARLQTEKNGVFHTIRSFEIDRRRNALNAGFDPYAPISVSFPATTSRYFRLILKKSVIANKSFPQYGIRELALSTTPKVEWYPEKTLAKMYQAPLPYWNEYQWPTQPTVTDKDLLIDPLNVSDISRYMSAEGHLNWDVSAGDWVIMRMGMMPTGVNNSPASEEGTGLEVDKMSKEHTRYHFDAFLGEIMRRIPAQDRKTWKVVVQDSYETGGQNWTDGFIEKFKANYGYDPLPYLPALQGKVVGSPEMCDRFLWDLRRLIADKVAYDYVGGLREVSHEKGLTTWLENYGHWGFPGEFLQYGGQSDEVAGEFWCEGELGNIENRAASSSAHIYGKIKVSAESFTSGGRPPYTRYPASVKQRADRFFTEGINNTLLHVFIHQPDERSPGINASFGTEFNRHNTWFSYLDLFTAYLKRCNFMLQQGTYVADVAYFIGEDAPKMTGVTDPGLPLGYAFDYINGEVIRNRTYVKNGRIYLPDGLNYGLLVLPKLETMRPELLEKIRDLVAQGATILGPAPERSPSLQNYPLADDRIKAMAKELWGDIDGVNILSHKYGKGRVLYGMDVQSALKSLHITPDHITNNAGPILFIHRTTPEAEIYYLSNQKNRPVNIISEFRISGKRPELWDPMDGTVRILPQYDQKNGITSVPLKLDRSQSTFIVFRKAATPGSDTGTNYPDEVTLAVIKKPWQVTFDPKMRGPERPVIFNELSDWTANNNNQIRYYSGTATYYNTVQLKKPAAHQHVYLNLGEVNVIARVKINGIDVGGAWAAPWRVDITKAVRPGSNRIEISVANTWVNRLIGDSKLPPGERKSWTNNDPYKPNSPLEPSGLKGPVFISMTEY